MTMILYHNPNCSKSRAALALLEASGHPFIIREYLKDPLDASEIRDLLTLLDIEPNALIRSKEPILKTHNIDLLTCNRCELIELMVLHPILIERPILAVANKASIGRPIERITALVNQYAPNLGSAR
jgi:arsenate reductase